MQTRSSSNPDVIVSDSGTYFISLCWSCHRFENSVIPGLYLAVIPDSGSDLRPVLLFCLQLWLPDPFFGQRPELRPHEQLRLQLGDHRRLRDRWWEGNRRPWVRHAEFTLRGGDPPSPQSRLLPQLVTQNVVQERKKTSREHLNEAPVWKTQKQSVRKRKWMEGN